MTLPVVFVMGPTASGKTDVALALAQRHDVQIISCDSSLVYRGMDIGTAKPGPEELEIAPHRLIDICDPFETYSAAQFVNDARREIAAARSLGRLPVLVGGTMLYFNALENGLSPLPSADADIRRALESEATEIGWNKLHKRLESIDPQAAKRIHPNDPQRIQRALEVWQITGRTLTQHHQANKKNDASLSPVIKMGLYPEPRKELHDRIARRFDGMLEAGFIDEVIRLRDDARITQDLPAMRSVGYRQAWRFLDGEIDEPVFREQAVAATRQLAKRQFTWLRGMSDVLLLDSIKLSSEAICDRITALVDAQ